MPDMLANRYLSVINYCYTYIYVHSAYLQVFNRLQKLALCMSHRSTVRLIEQLGRGHDSALIQWRDNVMPLVQVSYKHVTYYKELK